jgi:hypothetical protein
MRELGVRSPLRAEGAVWARAPGQCHRDRNVRNQILSVKGVPTRCRPLTPDLAQLSRGPGHCSSCPFTCSTQRFRPWCRFRSAGTRVWSPISPPSSSPPSPNRNKEKMSPHECHHRQCQPPFMRTDPIVTCPWRQPPSNENVTRLRFNQHSDRLHSVSSPRALSAAAPKIRQDSGALPHLAESRWPARRCGRRSPRAGGFNPCPKQMRCDLIKDREWR